MATGIVCKSSIFEHADQQLPIRACDLAAEWQWRTRIGPAILCPTRSHSCLRLLRQFCAPSMDGDPLVSAKGSSQQRTDNCCSVVPVSTSTRLILAPFSATGCINGGRGFDDNVLANPPAALLERGIRASEWQDMMTKLAEVQAKQNSLLCIIVMLVVGCLPCLCLSQRNYQRDLRAWLQQLNDQLLAPRGLFAKFQTTTVQYNCEHHIFSRDYSWLAVALTAEETERLRAEPVQWSRACCQAAIRPHCLHDCFCCCFEARVV